MRNVAELSRAPHPLGSAEHKRVREYIATRLEELGLEVEIQQDTVVEPYSSYIMAARIHNIVARRRGSTDGEALLLSAHYDTRPTTPGAGDDSSGIAVILELLRALGDEPLERDVVVLISDGEELGLLGARAFVDGHRWADSIGLVMNFEARGNRGAALMFETGTGNQQLIERFAAVAPHPMANSLTFDVYQKMPNDTDFTIFKEAGWTGYNFAFVEGYPAYHTALDRPESLSADSLSQEGANALALVRSLGNEGVAIDEASAVYFNPWGSRFVSYSQTSARIGLALAVLLLLVVGWLGGRRGWLNGGAALHGVILWSLVLLGGPIAGMGVWLFFRRLAPSLELAPHGFHYASTAAFVALLLIAIGVASFLAARQLGPRSLFQIAYGVALGWGVLGGLSLVYLMGGSYLILWPLLSMAGGLLGAVALEKEDPSSLRVLAILGIAGLPSALLIAPVALLMVQALTLQLAIVVLFVAVLGLTSFLPHLATIGRRLEMVWILGMMFLGILALGWIGMRSEFDAQNPRTNNLFLVADLDSERAEWWSFDSSVDPWTSAVIDASVGRKVLPSILPLASGAHGLFGAAPAAEMLKPEVEVTKDERADGGRQVGIALRSARGATNLHIRAEAAVAIDRVAIAGQEVAIGEEGLEVLRLVCFGVPEEGLQIELDVSGRWPIEAIVGDQSYGLQGLGLSERPDEIIPSSSWWTDSVFAYSEYLF